MAKITAILEAVGKERGIQKLNKQLKELYKTGKALEKLKLDKLFGSPANLAKTQRAIRGISQDLQKLSRMSPHLSGDFNRATAGARRLASAINAIRNRTITVRVNYVAGRFPRTPGGGFNQRYGAGGTGGTGGVTPPPPPGGSGSSGIGVLGALAALDVARGNGKQIIQQQDRKHRQDRRQIVTNKRQATVQGTLAKKSAALLGGMKKTDRYQAGAIRYQKQRVNLQKQMLDVGRIQTSGMKQMSLSAKEWAKLPRNTFRRGGGGTGGFGGRLPGGFGVGGSLLSVATATIGAMAVRQMVVQGMDTSRTNLALDTGLSPEQAARVKTITAPTDSLLTDNQQKKLVAGVIDQAGSNVADAEKIAARITAASQMLYAQTGQDIDTIQAEMIQLSKAAGLGATDIIDASGNVTKRYEDMLGIFTDVRRIDPDFGAQDYRMIIAGLKSAGLTLDRESMTRLALLGTEEGSRVGNEMFQLIRELRGLANPKARKKLDELIGLDNIDKVEAGEMPAGIIFEKFDKMLREKFGTDYTAAEATSEMQGAFGRQTAENIATQLLLNKKALDRQLEQIDISRKSDAEITAALSGNWAAQLTVSTNRLNDLFGTMGDILGTKLLPQIKQIGLLADLWNAWLKGEPMTPEKIKEMLTLAGNPQEVPGPEDAKSPLERWWEDWIKAGDAVNDAVTKNFALEEQRRAIREKIARQEELRASIVEQLQEAATHAASDPQKFSDLEAARKSIDKILADLQKELEAVGKAAETVVPPIEKMSTSMAGLAQAGQLWDKTVDNIQRDIIEQAGLIVGGSGVREKEAERLKKLSPREQWREQLALSRESEEIAQIIKDSAGGLSPTLLKEYKDRITMINELLQVSTPTLTEGVRLPTAAPVPVSREEGEASTVEQLDAKWKASMDAVSYDVASALETGGTKAGINIATSMTDAAPGIGTTIAGGMASMAESIGNTIGTAAAARISAASVTVASAPAAPVNTGGMTTVT